MRVSTLNQNLDRQKIFLKNLDATAFSLKNNQYKS